MKTTAALFTLPRFDPAARFVAGRDLRWGMPDGSVVDIPGGSEIDLRALGLSEAEARKFYRTRHIAMVLDDERPAAVAIRHRGHGRWAIVDQAGNVLRDGLDKPEAERLLAEAA